MIIPQIKYFFVAITLFSIKVAHGQLYYQATHISNENGEMLGYTRDMIQDSTGLLWFSSTAHGINVYDGKKIITYDKSSPKHFFPLLEGAQLLERKNRNFLISHWGFIQGVIYEYNPYSRVIVDSIYQQGNTPKRIYNLADDTQNVVWAVSDPYDEGDFVYLFKENEKEELAIIDTFQINTYVSIMQKDDHIFVTAKAAIRKYDLNGNLKKIYSLEDNGKMVKPFVMNVDAANKLYVKSDHEGEDKTSSNFFIYNEVRDEFELFPMANEEALRHTEYFTFIDDELWIGGLNENLWKVNLANGKVEDYTAALRDVLGSNFYLLGVFKDASNQRWVTTSKGLIKLTPLINHQVHSESNFPINITSIVKYNGLRDKEEYLNCASLTQIDLDPDDLWMEVDYSFPNYQEKLYYSYQLEGNKTDWSAPNKSGKLRLTGVPPGNYQLHLRAGKDPEQMNGAYRTLPVYVRGDWTKTWWFYTLFTLLFALVVYSITRYRYQLKMKRNALIQNLRIKISSELHDDVGTILSGVAMSAELMSLKAVDASKDRLMDLTLKSHEAMDKMRDIVWAIDSRKDKYGDLIIRMRSYCEKMFDDAGIEHKFTTGDIESELFINPEKRQNIYLIFKEAITNICKHSNAKFVYISLNKTGRLIQLTIADDGDDTAEKSKSAGIGLDNMKMRAKQMGGTISFESTSGFAVCLEAPLK